MGGGRVSRLKRVELSPGDPPGTSGDTSSAGAAAGAVPTSVHGVGRGAHAGQTDRHRRRCHEDRRLAKKSHQLSHLRVVRVPPSEVPVCWTLTRLVSPAPGSTNCIAQSCSAPGRPPEPALPGSLVTGRENRLVGGGGGI